MDPSWIVTPLTAEELSPAPSAKFVITLTQ